MLYGASGGGLHKADEYSQRHFVVPYVCMGKPCAQKGMPGHRVRLADQPGHIDALLDAMSTPATFLYPCDS